MPDRQGLGNTDNIGKREESKQSSSRGCVCHFKVGPEQQLVKSFPLQSRCHRWVLQMSSRRFPQQLGWTQPLEWGPQSEPVQRLDRFWLGFSTM